MVSALGLAVLLSILGGQDRSSEEIQVRRLPPPNGVQRCLRQLPGGADVRIQVTCRVNAIGGPGSCSFQPEPLSRAERYAAMCVSRPYQFRYADGRPATGRTVTYGLHLTNHPANIPEP